jgi:hypothetical protein
MGLQYGERVMDGLEKIFHLEQARNKNATNRGIETSASSHVMEYYTAKSVRRVLEYMAMDYFMLNIEIPEWAERILAQDNRGPSTQPLRKQ